MLGIENGKRKHTDQARQQGLSPSSPSLEQHFRIGAGPETVAEILEFGANFPIVVNLAIETKVESAVGSRHGLARGFR